MNLSAKIISDLKMDPRLEITFLTGAYELHSGHTFFQRAEMALQRVADATMDAVKAPSFHGIQGQIDKLLGK